MISCGAKFQYMILFHSSLFIVLPYFTMLSCCGKRLLSLHNFFLMKSHGDAPLLHICDVTWLNCTVMHLHRSKTFEKLQASRISLLIYPLALRKFRRLRTKLLLNARFNFIVQLLILSGDNPLFNHIIHTYTHLFILHIHTISFYTWNWN